MNKEKVYLLSLELIVRLVFKDTVLKVLNFLREKSFNFYNGYVRGSDKPRDYPEPICVEEKG